MIAMLTHLKSLPSWIYKQFIRVPTYTFGPTQLTMYRLSLHKSKCACKQCGCNETYVHYLHQKEQLEILIDRYQPTDENQPTK